MWDVIVGCFELGTRSVQLCLKDPRHYIAAVAYDDEKDEIVFNDSWPDRFDDGNGFNRRLKKADVLNLQNFIVVFGT
jgi:hypothetical protein